MSKCHNIWNNSRGHICVAHGCRTGLRSISSCGVHWLEPPAETCTLPPVGAHGDACTGVTSGSGAPAHGTGWHLQVMA